MLLFPSLRAHRKQANRSAITGVRLAWLNPNPIYRQHSKIEIARYLIPLVFCIFPSVYILHAICSLQIANCSLRSALTLLFCFFFWQILQLIWLTSIDRTAWTLKQTVFEKTGGQIIEEISFMTTDAGQLLSDNRDNEIFFAFGWLICANTQSRRFEDRLWSKAL